MSLKVTTNIDSLPEEFPSLEHLGKYSPDEQKKALLNYTKAQQDKLEGMSSLSEKLANKQITKEQFEEQKLQISNNIFQSFHRTPAPNISTGKNGIVASKHKNKMGFIFIGDTKKAEDDKKSIVNNPKICLAIGGGLETTYDPKKKKFIEIDPRTNFLPQATAQLHLISSTNIDVEGIFDSKTLKNRSSIKAEADILELYSKEAVLIRSLGRPYLSSGARSFAPGGVHIVSGVNYQDPEPMVLGKKLSDFLLKFVELVNEIVTNVLNMSSGIIELKSVLRDHVHVFPGAPPGVAGTIPSPQIFPYVVATAIKDDFKTMANLKSILINLELTKLNYLTALSPERFMSDFNRVN